jgi:hypothetical protein
MKSRVESSKVLQKSVKVDQLGIAIYTVIVTEIQSPHSQQTVNN